jgi:hypothetical protein
MRMGFGNMDTKKLVVLSLRNSEMEAHDPKCADIDRKKSRGLVENSWTELVDMSSSSPDLAFQLACSVNEDFAGDLDMDIVDYVNQGRGYSVRVLPCVHSLLDKLVR